MKINLRIVAALVAVLSVCPLPGLSATPSNQTNGKLWSQVDSLVNIGQPRSALEIVDKIYQAAKAGKNDPQVVKAVIYRIRLNADFQENFLKKSIADLRKEISGASLPSKPILQSILAELYWKYYQTNEYRFRNRSRVAQNHSDSIESWDLTTLYTTIATTYLASIEQTDTLKTIAIEKFTDILECDLFGEQKMDHEIKLAAKFHPTLYDFLAGRALDFFTSRESAKVIPANRFEVDQTWYLAPTRSFVMNRMLIPADTASPASFALRIFRDLAGLHFKDQDRAALIDVELKRLEFVHNEAIFPGKDSLYIAALENFDNTEAGSPWSTSISYALAGFLNDQGQKYQPLVSERFKWRIKEAVKVCDEAIKRFPDAEGAKNCSNLKQSMLAPSLRITTENAVPVEKPSLALVNSANIKELNFRLLKVDPAIYAEKTTNQNQEGTIQYLASVKALKSWELIIPNDGDYQNHAFEIRIPEVSAGFYILLASTSENFSDKDAVVNYTPFWSTQIGFISRRLQDGTLAFYLSDRITGLPLKNAKAEVWAKNYNYRERGYTETKLSDVISDEQGLLMVPPVERDDRNNNIFLKITVGNDLFITANFFHYPQYQEPVRTSLETKFYTDRAVFRPGQTISFKAIVLEKNGDQTRIKSKHSTRIVFTDVNGQKISEQTLTTNAFGSVQGTFTAPLDLLPGMMTISNESGSVQVLVESYKLPTFEVIQEPLEGNYKLGERVNVTGKAKAFAGNLITGASVAYRVVRSTRFPWFDRFCYWPVPNSPEVEIANGYTTTDADGKFTIDFTAYPDLTVEKETNPVYDFTMYADVTDLNGETQSSEQAVSIGYTSLVIGIRLPEMFNRDVDTVFAITATNLNGRRTPAQIGAKLVQLRQPDRLLKPRAWERPDRNLMTRDEFHSFFPYDAYGEEDSQAAWPVAETIFEKTLDSKTDTLISLQQLAARTLQPGSYLLTLKATDPFGQPVEVKKFFTVFSPTSKEAPVNTFFWFVPLKTTGEPGEKARFQVGSKEDNVHVLYEITRHDSLVSRQWLKLGDRAMIIEIPITEKLRGNFAASFSFIRQNRVFQNNELVHVPYPNRKLGIKFESLRYRLDPGAKETWKIKIYGPEGKPAMAEFMAAMYDASLDVFHKNTWEFSLYKRVSGTSPWDDQNAFNSVSGISKIPYFAVGAPVFHPELRLNWFGFSYYGGRGRYRGQSKGGPEIMMAMDGSSGNAQPGAVPPPPPAPENNKVKFTPPVVIEETVEPKPQPSPSVQVRRDFRETAFFYPSLVTDSTGSLSLQFTVPSSLTKWRLMGLATTQNLEYGLVEKELITQKDLMVFPNAPRFVRKGDTVVFSAKIVNLSDKDLSAMVTLELSDALTRQSFNSLIDSVKNSGSYKRTQNILVKQGGSISTFWTLNLPVSTDLSLLQYRVTASAGSFSDGEEKVIPVLMNRMLVTESLPLPVKGKGTTTFSFEKLLRSGAGTTPNGTLKNHKLTLEFATNPAWYAVQALPTLNDQQYETADAVFSAYWSNSVASHIANSNPRIQAVFDSWKALSPDALKSNLSKNEELKQVLLQETPWVMEATSETERKQKLGLYFDHNRIEENLRVNLAKLVSLQLPGGGWSWMKGMSENRYSTQAILTGLGKLHHLGVQNISNDPALRNMVVKAIEFLDKECVKEYNQIKKNDKDWAKNNHLGSSQVQYLYARSFFMRNAGFGLQEMGPETGEVFGYYLKQAEKFWLKQDRQVQGMIALALNRLGNKDVPPMIMKSLAEKALHSGEMGMYWASEPGYFWYQAPIETQAMMVEAFDEVSHDEKLVEELKIWLLKQKQTQSWKSSRATLDACYALLLRGADLLDPGPDGSNGNITITLGKEKIDAGNINDVKKEPGTGYFQVSWTGNEIKPEMGNVTVSKPGQGVAWGALYWQYFENLDKITPAATPLHLEKRLFVEVNTAAGPVLEEIARMGRPESKSGNLRSLKIGDKLVVRIVLTADRDLEFVHMKDLRASALEPQNSSSKKGGSQGQGLSGYQYQDGLGYYQSTTDVATNFYFDYLPKGTYVFEYELKVNAAGDYSNGITTIRCLYAPEFSAHSEGVRICVE